MDIIYSGAGGRSIDWTTKYATSEMKKFIFGSKYLETRKKDYNDIKNYIEGVPKINDTLDKKEFDKINDAAITKIKATKIKDMAVTFEDVYFLDLVGKYTIQQLGNDRVLDEITGETSRVDFEDVIQDGWRGDMDTYYNELWKSGKVSEKTSKNKEVKTIILDETDLESVTPNVGKPRTKIEKISSLGFEYIYGDKINRNINLREKGLGKEGKSIKPAQKFGLEGKKVIPDDLMQSYDKFYQRVKISDEGKVSRTTFDLPYVFTRSLYFAEEMKESVEEKIAKVNKIIKDFNITFTDKDEDKTYEQKKLESLTKSLKNAKKYLRMTANLRKEIKNQMEVYNKTDDLLDSVRKKIENAEQLTDEELNSISEIGELERLMGKKKVKINFKDEYLKFTDKKTMPEDEYLLELFDELTDIYDNVINKRVVEWLEKYEELGLKLNKEFEKNMPELPKTKLTSKEQREAFNNPKSFIKNDKDIIRALNDLKVVYRIELKVTKETKKKKDKEVTTYTVNTFMLTMKEELVPPIVPKGTGGGSEASPFRQRGVTRRASPSKETPSPLAIEGKKSYEVKNDINLFAKRINKKLRQLELVI